MSKLHQSSILIRAKAVSLLVNFINHDESPENKYHQQFKGGESAYLRRLVHSFMKYYADVMPLIESLSKEKLDDKKISFLTATLIGGAIEFHFLKTPSHAVLSQYMEIIKKLDISKHNNFYAIMQKIIQTPSDKIKSRQTPLEQQMANYYSEDIMKIIMRAHRREVSYYFQYKNGKNQVIPQGVQITKNSEFLSGECWVQDIAASLPARFITNPKDKRILDLCAAPGGKTMQLASLGAEVVALEINPYRAKMIEDNLSRCQLKAQLKIMDAFKLPKSAEFDAVLVDAPCTASGTARKNPDILFKIFDFANYQKTQLKLLNHAKSMLKPGGEIIYSVCSVFPEESIDVILQFLDANNDFRLDDIDKKLIPANLKNYAQSHIHANNLDSQSFKGVYQTLSDEVDGFFIARIVNK